MLQPDRPPPSAQSPQRFCWLTRWRQGRSPNGNSDDWRRTLKAQLLKPASIGYALVGLWTGLGALATSQDWGVVQWLDRQSQTLFFELRGPVAPPDNIVLVALDERTDSQARFYQGDANRPPFVKLLETAPPQRATYATVLERLFGAGARAVAIDILFLDASGHGAADDQQLQQALQRYQGRVALAAEYAEDTAESFSVHLSEPSTTLATNPATVIGYVNALPSADNRVHTLPSQYRSQVIEPLRLKPIPSFSEAALQAAGLPPVPPKGSTLFFYGPPGRTFPTVSLWDVMDPAEWQRLAAKQVFKDKLVIIGATADSYQDFIAAPFSESYLYPGRMPGVEVHANAVATLMQGRAIADAIPNYATRGLFVLALGTVAAVLMRLPKRDWLWLLGGLGLAFLWGAVGYLCFTAGLLIVPTVVPMAVMVMNGTSYFFVGAISEELERRKLRRTLERYVAPAIVREILKQPDDYHSLLKGRKIKAAVLFSDIRSFTTISETMAAEDDTEHLVEQLNIYLDAMVNAIVEAGGTIDKFIGDAVMAEFGSPLSHSPKDDALNAVRAALAMRKALIQLREQWKAENRVLFFNGIGINYGELIAGNIGSEKRLEYTVIGDTVNVASRVEGVTKEFGVDILITKSVYELVQEELEVSYMGESKVKGHGKAIALYSVIGWKGENPEEYLKMRDELRRFINWRPPLNR